MRLNKPFHEVLEWPDSELEWWSATFSIETNKDKPNANILLTKAKASNVSEEIDRMKSVLSL